MAGALERWDGFLAQLQRRHHDVVVEAEAAARHVISMIAGGGDSAPLAHQLAGVDARLQELETRITDTWHAQVDQAICDDGHPPALRDRAYARGQEVKRALDDQREELAPRVFAELARQRYAHALLAARAVACGTCGARRDGVIAFRATELVCGCGARVAFEPGELMRSVAAIGAHAIAQEAAVGPWRAMRAAHHRMHDLRPPRPLEPIVAYERSQLAYWRAYLGVRSQLEPELARDPALELRMRMEPWYVSAAEYEPAWVAAGRPRAPLW